MGNGNELTLRQEVSTAILGKVDPVVLTTTILPRIERALQLAQTPEETNEIRAQIETVTTYLKWSLPKILAERREQFKYTHEGDMLYLRASAQAGTLWGACENKRPQGMNQSSENFRKTISWQDAGFKSDRDVTTCTRIAEIHEEDWRTYEEETLIDMRQPTLNGLENIWRMLYNVEVEQEEIPPPAGKFRTIIVDPPWQMEKIDREVRPNQFGFDYPTMSLDEIKAFSIPGDLADDECHLFLWTTQKFLPDAFDVLVDWGFKYVFTMVWHKPGGFQPYNLPQYNCEFVLYARRGGASFVDTKDFFTCFNAPRREHSRKPVEFYQLIERVCPGPRIDIFSREKHSGFEQYGNEIEKFTGSS